MREWEVKEKIGSENWIEFCRWMRGQTCGTYPNGDTDFYECDVEAFVTKLRTWYDRQESPYWD